MHLDSFHNFVQHYGLFTKAYGVSTIDKAIFDLQYIRNPNENILHITRYSPWETLPGQSSDWIEIQRTYTSSNPKQAHGPSENAFQEGFIQIVCRQVSIEATIYAMAAMQFSACLQSFSDGTFRSHPNHAVSLSIEESVNASSFQRYPVDLQAGVLSIKSNTVVQNNTCICSNPELSPVTDSVKFSPAVTADNSGYTLSWPRWEPKSGSIPNPVPPSSSTYPCNILFKFRDDPAQNVSGWHCNPKKDYTASQHSLIKRDEEAGPWHATRMPAPMPTDRPAAIPIAGVGYGYYESGWSALRTYHMRSGPKGRHLPIHMSLLSTLAQVMAVSYLMLVLSLISFFKPVPIGYRRLYWQCECGMSRYGDYRSNSAQSLDELETSLQKMNAENRPSGYVPSSYSRDRLKSTPRIRYDGAMSPLWAGRLSAKELVLQEKKSSQAKDVSDASQSPNAGRNESVARVPISDKRDLGNPFDKAPGKPSSTLADHHLPHISDDVSSYTARTTSQESRRRRFLEMCVNTSPLKISLGELSLDPVSSMHPNIKTDGELFNLIHRRYFEIRKFSFFRWLYTPVDIQFVRFSVFGAGHVGIYDQPMSLPPPSEVKKGNYHYYECPLDPLPPIDHRTFFHYFWNHERHLHAKSTIFLDRLPKKLNLSMREQEQLHQLNLGWGVHIIEGPNKKIISLCLLLIIALSLLVSVGYSVLTHAQESGFGIGQWIVATLTVGLSSVYFHVAE